MFYTYTIGTKDRKESISNKNPKEWSYELNSTVLNEPSKLSETNWFLSVDNLIVETWCSYTCFGSCHDQMKFLEYYINYSILHIIFCPTLSTEYEH